MSLLFCASSPVARAMLKVIMKVLIGRLAYSIPFTIPRILPVYDCVCCICTTWNRREPSFPSCLSFSSSSPPFSPSWLPWPPSSASSLPLSPPAASGGSLVHSLLHTASRGDEDPSARAAGHTPLFSLVLHRRTSSGRSEGHEKARDMMRCGARAFVREWRGKEGG